MPKTSESSRPPLMLVVRISAAAPPPTHSGCLASCSPLSASRSRLLVLRFALGLFSLLARRLQLRCALALALLVLFFFFLFLAVGS